MRSPRDLRVHSNAILANVVLMQHVLESHGIPCEIRGVPLGGAAGELPPTETWPELWVLDQSRADESQALVREALASSEKIHPSWTCSGCREEVEGQFEVCWSCGAERR